MTKDPQAAGFVVAWLYRPRPGVVGEFERAYGSDGPWGELFARAGGYLGTELYVDGDTYLVLDRWDSQDAHDRFEQTFGAEYGELSERSERLHQEETRLGSFGRVPRTGR